MDISKINAQMETYLSTREMVGGALIIRQENKILLRNKWGSCDAEGNDPVSYDTIYRMASMTKPVTAVAVMKLFEQGKIDINDELAKYIPTFKNMQVVSDERYEYSEQKLMNMLWLFLSFRQKKVKTIPAERAITIRDLLSHSSGLEQGLVGLILLRKRKRIDDTLESRALNYASQPLDFQPGTSTNYSPTAGFDILARIVEIASGRPFDVYLKDEVFQPLGMKDATFHPTSEQWERIQKLYQYNKGKIKDVTGSRKDINSLGRIGPRYSSGSAGLYCSLEDYDRFVQMLANEGEVCDGQILEPSTVRMMREEGACKHLEFLPGSSWGLGMLIWQEPEKSHRSVSKGTFGWSGAFGTHFFISPKDKLSVVFMMNRADIGGADSYISRKLEELVFLT